jgi:hypothetical protein
MGIPRTHDERGSVECPYCGHQIAKNVRYNGQIMHCQKCTSAVHAPQCDGGSDSGDSGCGCVFLFLLLFAVGIGIAYFAFGVDFLDIILSSRTWGLLIFGIFASAALGYFGDN